MADARSIAGDIASAVQSASITHHPDPRHDLNPSTAASRKEPVQLSARAHRAPHPRSPTDSAAASTDADEAIDVDIDVDEDVADSGDEIPLSALRPLPRRQTLPPLPDLRFEQSYLRSIAACEGRPWAVAWVTLRDQVLLALFQGFAWTLVLGGWRHANRAGKFGGRGAGARLRRWWWGVNGWALPGEGHAGAGAPAGTGAGAGGKGSGRWRW